MNYRTKDKIKRAVKLTIIIAVIGFIVAGIVMFSTIIYRRAVWNDFMMDFAGTVYETNEARAVRDDGDVRLSEHNRRNLFNMLTNGSFGFALFRPDDITESIYVYFDNGSEMEICDTEEGFVWVELYCANGEDYSFLLGKDVRFSYIDGITSVKGGAVANEPWTEKE